MMWKKFRLRPLLYITSEYERSYLVSGIQYSYVHLCASINLVFTVFICLSNFKEEFETEV